MDTVSAAVVTIAAAQTCLATKKHIHGRMHRQTEKHTNTSQPHRTQNEILNSPEPKSGANIKKNTETGNKTTKTQNKKQ